MVSAPVVDMVGQLDAAHGMVQHGTWHGWYGIVRQGVELDESLTTTVLDLLAKAIALFRAFSASCSAFLAAFLSAPLAFFVFPMLVYFGVRASRARQHKKREQSAQ